MKRSTVFLILLLSFLLSSCTSQPQARQVQVSVVEAEGIAVEKNGILVEPGGTAVFHLKTDGSCQVTGTDYNGECRLTQEDGYTLLELYDVRVPTRVELELSGGVRTVTYEPNGGEGEPQEITYSLENHPRPNTASYIFSRGGFTLTGWNTRQDGTGAHIGLGSRASAPPSGLTLYAEWAPWTAEALFTARRTEGGLAITGYNGTEERIVIPETIAGETVVAIASGAFRNCSAREIILPRTLQSIEPDAFQRCAVEELTLFDNLEDFSDASFSGCASLATLRINAVEDPYGYRYRRESVYADKVELLIGAAGTRKLVFYGGCSMWYNLDSTLVEDRFGGEYAVINLGLNGLVSSYVQMEIMRAFLEPGDVLFHAPELCSEQQLLTDLTMSEEDVKLWCGLEMNYDLFTLVDIRPIRGVFDSLHDYLSLKKPGGRYEDVYLDSEGRSYMSPDGCLPFEREGTAEKLVDDVGLSEDDLRGGLGELAGEYRALAEKDVSVYVSCGCVNNDAVPEEERGNAEAVGAAFNRLIGAMDGAVPISELSDYIFHTDGFYDTNYHMTSAAARENTARWLRDLEAALSEES